MAPGHIDRKKKKKEYSKSFQRVGKKSQVKSNKSRTIMTADFNIRT